MARSNQTEVSDFTGFDQLFIKNHQFLCMVALKIVRDDFVAKDLVQDFFVKYWESRFKIEPKNFEAYACRSVKNSCLNYLKHLTVEEKHRIARPVSELESGMVEDIEIDMTERDRKLKNVLHLLDKLPAERRKVFELHAIGGLTYKQIAKKMGISVNTVKTQLKRAYSTLRRKEIIAIIFSSFIKYFY